MMKLKKCYGRHMRSSMKPVVKSEAKSGKVSTLTSKPILVKIPKSSFSNDFLSDSCACCHGDIRSLKREFSSQAWAALVAWQEISIHVVDQSVCDDCYLNLRDTLIERADELKARSINAFANTSLEPPMSGKTQPVHKTNLKKRGATELVELRVMV